MATEKQFNLSEYVAPIMTLGTWLFAMYQFTQGVHYVPDEWMLGIILAPHTGKLYSLARDKVTGAFKRLPKRD